MVELTMPDLAGAMRAAVRGLVDRLDTEQRGQLVFPFDGDMHKRWTYLPGQRPGLRLGDLSEEQLAPALDLLQLVHSVRGWSDTQLVIRIEAVRREISHEQAGRDGVDPYRDLPYWLVVLGDPTSTDPWAWRINGHHLLAQATVVGDQVNGVPHFFGAEPAAVLEGPHAGLRALPREEDLARELMLALQEDQRRMARIAVKAPADIASRWDPVAALPGQPRGIRYAGLDRHHRRRTRRGVLRVGRAGAARHRPLLRAQRPEPAHRVRQHPGWGQPHPLRVARPTPRLRRGPAGTALRGRAPLIGLLADTAGATPRWTSRPSANHCWLRWHPHADRSAGTPSR